MKRRKGLGLLLLRLLLGVTMSAIFAESDEYGEGTRGAEGTQKFWEEQGKKIKPISLARKIFAKFFP